MGKVALHLPYREAAEVEVGVGEITVETELGIGIVCVSSTLLEAREQLYQLLPMLSRQPRPVYSPVGSSL